MALIVKDARRGAFPADHPVALSVRGVRGQHVDAITAAIQVRSVDSSIEELANI